MRKGIEFEAVAKVCEQFNGQGIDPNQRNVRAELGTGSASTLVKHINEWKDQKAKERKQSFDVPINVSSSIINALAEAVELATSELNDLLIDNKVQLNDTIRALELQESDNEKLVSDMAEAKAKTEGKELELQKQLSGTQSQVEELSNQIKTITEKLEVTILGQEAARTEAAKAQMQIERADKATLIAEAHNQELKLEVSERKEKVAAAEAAANTAKAVAEEQSKTIKRLDVKQTKDLTMLADVQKKFEKLQGEYQSASRNEAAGKEQQKSITRLEKEHAALIGKHDELAVKHNNAIRAEASAQAKLEMLRGDRKK